MNRKIVRKRKLFSIVFVLFLCVCAVAAAVIRCARLIEENYLENLEQNLADVSMQTADALTDQMVLRYELLDSIAMRFNLEPEKRQENLYMFEPVTEAFKLQRIGFCDKNGMAHATSGREINLSYREFFQKSMEGNVCISDVLKDAMSDEPEAILVMSMPVHNRSGEIDGVAFMTFKASVVNEELGIDSFDGLGQTVVFNNNGNINISSNPEILNIKDNFFDALWAYMGCNYDSRNQMLDELIDGSEDGSYSYGTLSLKGQDYYYHITPVTLMDNKTVWHCLSIVPVNYLQDRFAPTKRNLWRMIAIVLFLGFITISGVQIISLRQVRYTHKLAFCSELTGGPNLTHLLYVLRRNNIYNGYIVSMNIQNFKNTSVAVGELKTEKLLRQTWEILKQEEKKNDMFCHEKKDSFVLYLAEPSKNQVKKRLQTIQTRIQDESKKQHVAFINPKFGISELNSTDKSRGTYQKAEVALNDAQSKANGIAFYDPEKQKEQIENQKLEEAMDEGIQNNEFQMYFQAKYNAKENGKITGCEALVRWNHKERGLISPGVFIPLAEQTGKIVKLDEYILRAVCARIQEWKEKKLPIVPVSVNVSKATLYRDRIFEKYMGILKEYGVKPSEIQFEVTETLIAAGPDIAKLLNRFRQKGIKVLMDDFGTGYTALNILNFQCFDTLKMDKCLIDEIKEEYGRELLGSIIQMTKRLGYYITAEGVENNKQADFLKAVDCDDIQGYLYAHPEPAEIFEKRLV